MSNTKIRAKWVDGITELRILVRHPMNTGRQRDPTTGSLIPAHYIQQLTVEHKGQSIINCELSTAVSRDPYLSFRFAGGRPGDKVKVRWQDNLGQVDQQETLIRHRSDEQPA